MQLYERIKYVRESLEMSRASFGKALGVSGDVINNWERGRVEIKEYILNLICKTFRVNYFWLTEESGDPFVSVSDILIDSAIEEYELDSFDRTLIEEYAKLPKESRAIIKELIRNVFDREKAPD